jgi:uncharacterized protein (DUF1501 family)
LLGQTLVLVNSEMGRQPKVGDPRSGGNKGAGRDHWTHCMSVLFAGGGVKGGQVIGETDELGVKAVGDRYHMRDFHATILHLLGLEQTKLWYLHNGRQEKLTDFGGNPIARVWGG